MSTSIATPAATATATAAAPAVGRVCHPEVPARTGNAPVRQALAAGVHPATGQPLLNPDTPNTPTGCGGCALVYTLTLPARPGQEESTDRLKCSQAPVSRRGRQGVDLRPNTPACALYRPADDQDHADRVDGV
ncbi:hypothetical protein ABZ468_35305 [Streptomyces sp. NPDC005708]|uniref:hypothetical protein n=1 Tax=Streptomyces sp. NPDC005708 TaxID=3154564 RepID=UPI0033E8F9A3